MTREQVDRMVRDACFVEGTLGEDMAVSPVADVCCHVKALAAAMRLESAGQNITIEAQQIVVERQQATIDGLMLALKNAERERLQAIDHYEGKMQELAGFRDEWERCATETREVFGKVTKAAGKLLGHLDGMIEYGQTSRRIGLIKISMMQLTESIESAYVETPKGDGL